MDALLYKNVNPTSIPDLDIWAVYNKVQSASSYNQISLGESSESYHYYYTPGFDDGSSTEDRIMVGTDISISLVGNQYIATLVNAKNVGERTWAGSGSTGVTSTTYPYLINAHNSTATSGTYYRKVTGRENPTFNNSIPGAIMHLKILTTTIETRYNITRGTLRGYHADTPGRFSANGVTGSYWYVKQTKV